MQRHAGFDADGTGEAFRIFERDADPQRPRDRARRETWHEPAGMPTASAPAPASRSPSSTARVDPEHRMLEILRAAPAPGETIEAAYTRKEHELGALFAALPPPEALALHRRLTSARRGDVIAGLFARMIEARRARLLAFLADARRRAARARSAR